MRLPAGFYLDDAALPALQTVATYFGTTTAAGNALGTTLVDAGLITEPGYPGLSVKLLGTAAAGQSRAVLTQVAGTITVNAAFTDPAGAAVQVPAGTPFIIASIPGLFLPAANSISDITPADVIGNKADAASVAATASGIALLRSLIGAGIPSPQQVLSVQRTNASNAGLVTVATVGGQPVVIDSLVVHANAAAPANLTSAAVFGGVGQVMVFITAMVATQANLNAVDKQVAFVGAARLAVGKLIEVQFVGVGPAPVDFQFITTYHPEAAGGVLT